MRLLLFTLLFLHSLSLSAQDVVIPDPNFLQALIDKGVDMNGDGVIQVSEAEVVDSIDVSEKNIKDLTGIESFASLKYLDASNNILTALEVSFDSLETLWCYENELAHIDVSNCPSLKMLWCGTNPLIEIDVSNNPLLTSLSCSYTQLTEVDVSRNLLLTELSCGTNALTEIDVSNNPLLETFGCTNSQLPHVDLSNNPLLTTLFCGKNQLTEIDLSNNPLLTGLWCGENQLTEIDVSNNPLLTTLWCESNIISFLDFSDNPRLEVLYCYYNPLEYLNLNNGTALIEFWCDTDGLQMICVDEEELELIRYETGPNPPAIITHCQLGFPYNTYDVSGQIQFSHSGDCDVDGENLPNQHFKINNGTESIYKPIYNLNGYLMKLPANDYTMSLDIENADIFKIDPESVAFTLDSLNTSYNQDFCISPITDAYTDIAITLLDLRTARPGFEVRYKLLYENQGNTTSNGTIEITPPIEFATLVSSSPELGEINGTYTYAYENLKPFEKRELVFTVRLNSPMDNPPLTGGTITYEVVATPDEKEYDPTDNTFTLIQDVVNSYDPNDKTCLQGSQLLDEMIGEYVDYLIRFENLGTASAVNVTILDKIDTSVFDLSTMRITDQSHDMFLAIEDDVAKFVFENIELPFEAPENAGYVAYKIKTRPHLEVGDSLKNTANIFFDFNYPIQTNTTFTSIVTDMDGDGIIHLDDCDDNNADVYPGNIETPYNGLDDDCDPATLDDDLDQDGFLLVEDCDDDNSNINPDQTEEPYNGIDEDCNPATLDDDLDQDGFVLAEDCDDDNPDINPDQTEEPYNGIDEDCNSETLDDDLDQDGFLLVDDCDDNNPDIHPNATEIPDNGIDEDCDGMDLTTSVHELSGQQVNIYPNPVSDLLTIEIEGRLEFKSSLYDLSGRLIKSDYNTRLLSLEALPHGLYHLVIEDVNSSQKIVDRIMKVE